MLRSACRAGQSPPSELGRVNTSGLDYAPVNVKDDLSWSCKEGLCEESSLQSLGIP